MTEQAYSAPAEVFTTTALLSESLVHSLNATLELVAEKMSIYFSVNFMN